MERAFFRGTFPLISEYQICSMHDLLSTKAQSILEKQFGVRDAQVQWEYSPEEGHGDLSTAIALQLAKKLKKDPKDIASKIVEELKVEEGIDRAEFASPGYVNVWLIPQMLVKHLNATREACTAKVVRKNEPPVIIDYCSPNIAKPLGIHHILPHVIGQAIINIYRHLGWNVIGWSYPGDWGTQFGKLAVAFDRWGEGKKAGECTLDELLELYVRFHREAARTHLA